MSATVDTASLGTTPADQVGFIVLERSGDATWIELLQMPAAGPGRTG